MESLGYSNLNFYIFSCNFIYFQINIKSEDNYFHFFFYYFQDEKFEVSKFDFLLEIGPPSTKIYHFTGSIPLSTGERIPLTKDNLLLRDCMLRNTDYIEGLVVYAGEFMWKIMYFYHYYLM